MSLNSFRLGFSIFGYGCKSNNFVTKSKLFLKNNNKSYYSNNNYHLS